ncbi:response regulator transcription factor [Bacillus sp. 31A1R]|uniref:Response regulator transcription factor n=1 Tax=Robertmurraya mangrovi TaxID=3098077 RepID=A0ABU5IYA0_9BACI|nr:response regulator transcription factor [Bacillus sp. 31A1R]MDZ5472075.1 response regulator transcription factor [Bacillus sp. 31A1R]
MKYSILLVEDDREIAINIRNFLVNKNFEVTWATTGKEGWNDFTQGTYHLAIIDLMLPEMDGFTLCQNIRWKSDIPLLILSARHEEDDKVKGLKLGADDYLTKPFSFRELEARLQSHLRRFDRYRGEQNQEDLYHYQGGLSIYPDKKMAYIQNLELPLTVKEFSLLLLLAENSHKTFSKKELYEHIWDQEEVDGNNTITVHIKSLRSKLNDSTKNPHFIQTIWGAGYRFIGVPIHEN